MEANEMRAILDGIINDVDSGVSQLRYAVEQFEAAKMGLFAVRANSVDPLGLPILTSMLALTEEAIALRNGFAEALSSYRNAL